MTKIDLINDIPEEISQTASLDDLLQAVRNIEKWQDLHAEVLDYIYRSRLVRLLWRRAHIEELRAFAEHLAKIVHPRRAAAIEALGQPFAARWRAYQSILETRISGLQTGAPEKLANRAHVSKILELICLGQVQRQQDIENILGLRKANVTRILNMMEANELIVRTKIGVEKHLVPGPNAERVQPARPTQHRGAYFLRAV